MAGNNSQPGRSVISKIGLILQAVADGSGNSLTEIAARSGLPLSTVHRIANELAQWRVLERDPDGRFHTWRCHRACRARGVLGEGLPGVRDRAVDVMEDLFRVSQARVRVGVLDATEAAYVEKASRHLPVSRCEPAARLPLHATALGKALLAFAPPRTVDAVLGRPLARFSPQTLTSPDRLRWGLRTTRRTRIALCDRELDGRTCAVAAPVLGPDGEVVAAVELAVRDLAQDVPRLTGPLAVAAGALSRDLGRRAWATASATGVREAGGSPLRPVPDHGPWPAGTPAAPTPTGQEPGRDPGRATVPGA